MNNVLIYLNVENAIVLYYKNGTFVKTLQCKIDMLFLCVDYRGGMFISNDKSIIHIPESGSHNAHNEIPVKMKTDDKITGLDVDEQGRLYGCICNNKKRSS